RAFVGDRERRIAELLRPLEQLAGARRAALEAEVRQAVQLGVADLVCAIFITFGASLLWADAFIDSTASRLAPSPPNLFGGEGGGEGEAVVARAKRWDMLRRCPLTPTLSPIAAQWGRGSRDVLAWRERSIGLLRYIDLLRCIGLLQG